MPLSSSTEKQLSLVKVTLALRSAAELSTVARHVHVVGTSHEALQTPLGQMLNKAENVTVLEDYQGNQSVWKWLLQPRDRSKSGRTANGAQG